MATLTPLLTSVVPNPNIAFCNSWVAVENTASRPIFAQASYLVNASEITLSAGSIGVNLTVLENLTQATNSLLSALTGQTNRINGFVIPDYNEIQNYYYGSTNNVQKVEYKNNSTLVSTLSFTYMNNATSDGDMLKQVIKI
jgi:hypothetical protein